LIFLVNRSEEESPDMRVIVAVAVYAFAFCLSTALLAQDPSATPSPTKDPTATSSPAAQTPPARPLLQEGSEVALKFSQDLSSRTAVEDDSINFILDKDLKVGDFVIAKAGAKALGTVTRAHKSGMMGKGGELNYRLDYLLAGTERIKLRGSKGKEGDGKVGTAVALTVIFGPVGLLKHGKNVEIKEGTPLLAYVAENYTVPAAK
jgi:hypothetical protein